MCERLLAGSRQQMTRAARENMTQSIKNNLSLCFLPHRLDHSYLTVWVPQEGWGAANITGHQNKASESRFTGAESNLLHLSNSTGNKQELSQTSIKLGFVWTVWVCGTACRYHLWLNRSRDPANPFHMILCHTHAVLLIRNKHLRDIAPCRLVPLCPREGSVSTTQQTMRRQSVWINSITDKRWSHWF